MGSQIAARKTTRRGAPFYKNPAMMGKTIGVPGFRMHCRPEVMPVIVEKKMRTWLSILRCPQIDARCKPARARRNLLRLLSRHPEIGRKIGVTVVGIYSL